MAIEQLADAFIPIAACQGCKSNLTLASTGDLLCRRCDRVYSKLNGIWRFLSTQQQADFQSYLDGYNRVRRAEGWEHADDAYYLALPEVPRDDPQAHIWKIRRRTFDILKKQLVPSSQAWALDLGAGNCWLSRYLALAGYRVLALDPNVDGRDGLAGGAIYLKPRICSFLRGQADMTCLPVNDRQVDLCVISGALHHVDVQKTLQSVFRVLKPTGRLIIMDSPIFHDSSNGMKMRSEQLAQFELRYGVAAVATEGAGYLVLQDLLVTLKEVGFSTRIHWPGYWSLRIIRRFIHGTTFGRDTASFPVLVNIRL